MDETVSPVPDPTTLVVRNSLDNLTPEIMNRRYELYPLAEYNAWLDVGHKPWERLPRESGKAYKMFLVYRDLGFDRTLINASLKWRQMQGKPPKKHRTVNNTYRARYKRFMWKDRADKWDVFLVDEEERAWIDRRRTLRNTEWEASNQLFAAGLGSLKTIQTQVTVQQDPMKPRDIARFLAIARELGQKTRTEPATREYIQNFIEKLPEPLRDRIIALLQNKGG